MSEKKSDYCTFYIIRHGETEWNAAGRLQGHADSPLTKKGINQVKKLKKIIKHVHFDGLFSSDSGRARKTAEIINLERKLAVVTTALLREKSFGNYEGQLSEKFRNDLKKLLDDYEKCSDNEKKSFKLPGVETDEEAVSRFITFLRQVAIAYPRRTILVVSHGAMIRALLIHLGLG